MICAACGHQNREGRKFCTQCGASLVFACPACGSAAEPGERFCGECGASLGTRTSPESSPEAILASGERKQITVLFADVQGSMDLQEDLDPEAWAQIMGRFVAILAEGVRKYGGTVDKFTGDGIMALFGAPIAQEDHARRACHAAWHLTNAIAEYADELRRGQGVELHVRLGLNSGEVVVGRIGDDVTLDPTALGHTVGLAQRMEAMAQPGQAYLTEHTARLVQGWFRLEDLGVKGVKGARAQLRVYALGAPEASPRRRTVGPSPLVGRDRELAVLEDALAAAMEGEAHVVGVVGEAGVGKSRLCEEFARSAADRGITVRRTAGVSYGKGVPLLPVLALMRDYFGITQVDSPEEAREKVAGRVLDLDPGLEEALPLLSDFLEVPDPDRPAPKLGPDVRSRRIFDTLRRLTGKRSERESLVVIFEDLHWFDPQSETFLERLVESFPGSRTLVVANFRPEFSAPWMRHSYYRQLALAPLRHEALGELLGGLLGVDLSLAPLLAFVLERTGGNPFFVEEVVRTLVEDGTLAGVPGKYQLTRPLDAVKVPPTVQAVLAARIDRLPDEQKAVLQTAAVIGRNFPEPVLAQVTGLSEEALERALSGLCATELLQEAGRHPVADYRFWHPLTQEVAYETLLSERRARLHAAVAKALIEHNADRLDEAAAVIAWHWERAGRRFEAAQWSLRAGAWALRSDVGEARRRWRTAVDLREGVDETTNSLELGVWARIRLLQFGARTGIVPEDAERLYSQGRSRAERLADVGAFGFLVVASAAVRFWAGDVQGSLVRLRQAARLAEEADDPALQAALWMPIPAALFYTGPLAEGLTWADRVLAACAEDAERGVRLVGYSPLARTLQLRGALLARMGRLNEAASDGDRAVAIARSRAEPEILAWALALLPQIAWLAGEDWDAPGQVAEAVGVAEDTGDVASLVLALEAAALASLLARQPAEAAAACGRALDEARKHRSGLFEEASVLVHLARARLAAGDRDAAIAAAEEAVAVARRQGARVVECLALLIRAQTFRATGGENDVVLADLDAALDLVKETGALTYEPFIREEFGRLRGDDGELREALRLYRRIGATGHARRLEAELAGWSRSAGSERQRS